MSTTITYTCDWCDQPAVLRLLEQHLQTGPDLASFGAEPLGPLKPSGLTDLCIDHVRALRVTGVYEGTGGYVSIKWDITVPLPAL